MNKKSITILVVCLIVTVLSVSLAYYSARIIGNGKNVSVNAKELTINFDNNNEIASGIIEPGWSSANTFSITNKSKTNFTYDIVLKNYKNTTKTNGYLVYKITSNNCYNMNEYKDMLLNLDTEAELVSILHTINDGLADAVNCDELRVLHGRDYIHEEVLGLRFRVSPFSFFQTNTKGAEELYTIAREFVGDHNDKVVFDLYSGTGTIGQVMAKAAKKVYGIEIIEEAVVAANQNAKLNGLTNCEFVAGDVAKTVKNLKDKPDLIIVDPPRPGVHKDAVRDISNFGAKEIVYISCNPKTLVLDLVEFKKYGYELEKVKCMDMFPNTPHVETIVKLIKK